MGDYNKEKIKLLKVNCPICNLSMKAKLFDNNYFFICVPNCGVETKIPLKAIKIFYKRM